MNIGKGLRYWRKKKAVKQKSISEACGFSRTAVSAIEKGVFKPTWESVGKIAGYLGVSVGSVVIASLDKEDIDDVCLALMREVAEIGEAPR